MASGPFLSTGAWRTLVSANDSTQQRELGSVRYEGAKVFRYIRVSSAGTLTAAQAVSYSDTTGNTIKVCPAGTSGAMQAVVGIAETALSTSFFGWITVYGTATALVDTGALIGHALIGASTAGALALPGAVIATTVGTTASNLAFPVAIALTTGVLTGSLVFLRAF